ncbi:MAG: 2-iminoacetate synthase ThiH [Actinobacteria bacterium]|nr:2-iminoacetate synthase ThiH [Actinomycetota bacterium]
MNNNWNGFVGKAPSVTFANELGMIPFERLVIHAEEAGPAMVDRALSREPGTLALEDFAALLSPVAGERLEEMAQASREVTVARFGRTMQMYAPLYLSNECLSSCTYCGFARSLPIVRRTLNVAETQREARHLLAQGFRSILLLTGEHEKDTGVEFLEQHVRALSSEVPQISLEVQVWSEAEYARLVEAGCEGVTIYQETYHPQTYARVHEAGRKRRYLWRLLGPERAARAGMRRLGVGALLGLHPQWRYDAIAVAAHAAFLQRHYWRSSISVSIPRMRPSESHFSPEQPVSDRELTQYVCALRLFLPDAGLVASTREPAALRDGLFQVGITRTSAGSATEPGGYEEPDAAGEQFQIADERSVSEVVEHLRGIGYEPVWEDWARPSEAAERMLTGNRLPA